MTEAEFEVQLWKWIDTRIACSSVTVDDFAGVDEERIALLEAELGLTLPGCVRRFLAVSGARLGKLQAGSDYQFGALKLINTSGRETFKAEGVTLPADALIVFAHQGYDYLFLHTATDNADPPVYRYVEGRRYPQLRFPAFNGYVAWLFSGAPL